MEAHYRVFINYRFSQKRMTVFRVNFYYGKDPFTFLFFEVRVLNCFFFGVVVWCSPGVKRYRSSTSR